MKRLQILGSTCFLCLLCFGEREVNVSSASAGGAKKKPDYVKWDEGWPKTGTTGKGSVFVQGEVKLPTGWSVVGTDLVFQFWQDGGERFEKPFKYGGAGIFSYDLPVKELAGKECNASVQLKVNDGTKDFVIRSAVKKVTPQKD